MKADALLRVVPDDEDDEDDEEEQGEDDEEEGEEGDDEGEGYSESTTALWLVWWNHAPTTNENSCISLNHWSAHRIQWVSAKFDSRAVESRFRQPASPLLTGSDSSQQKFN